MQNQSNTIYKIRFFENDQKETLEAQVRIVEPSEFPGLVCFRDFVFKDQTKQIILPTEDKSSKRFNQTKAMHVPYHNILYIEEVQEEKIDLNKLPFLKKLPEQESAEDQNH